MGRDPHSGSLRFSNDLDIPALRAWPPTGFPHLYVERDREIDVLWPTPRA